MDGHSHQPLRTAYVVGEQAPSPMASRALNMKATHCVVEYSLGRHMSFLRSITHYYNLSSLKQHLVLTPQFLWLRIVEHRSSGSSAQGLTGYSQGVAGLHFHLDTGPGGIPFQAHAGGC